MAAATNDSPSLKPRHRPNAATPAAMMQKVSNEPLKLPIIGAPLAADRRVESSSCLMPVLIACAARSDAVMAWYSAIPPKADIAEGKPRVRFVPKADIPARCYVAWMSALRQVLHESGYCGSDLNSLIAAKCKAVGVLIPRCASSMIFWATSLVFVSLDQTKRFARSNEGLSHSLNRFGIERLIAQERADWCAVFTPGLVGELR